MINDARIPGLLPPDDVVTMEMSTVSGEHFPTVPITSLGDIGGLYLHIGNYRYDVSGTIMVAFSVFFKAIIEIQFKIE